MSTTLPAATDKEHLKQLKEIYFAGGCFWGVEEYFSRIQGVHDVTVGYANGYTENPTYQQVCSGNTGYGKQLTLGMTRNTSV